jgi:hypothetical protein
LVVETGLMTRTTGATTTRGIEGQIYGSIITDRKQSLLERLYHLSICTGSKKKQDLHPHLKQELLEFLLVLSLKTAED